MPDAPLTHARVLRIALPIVLSNATIPILGAVDTAVTGQLGQAALMVLNIARALTPGLRYPASERQVQSARPVPTA